MSRAPTSAERTARWRQRLANDRLLIAIEVHAIDWPMMLVELGKLQEHQTEDRQAVARATAKLIGEMKVMNLSER